MTQQRTKGTYEHANIEAEFVTPEQRITLVADILSDIALRIIKKQQHHENSSSSSHNV
jgi:hypothetical protein